MGNEHRNKEEDPTVSFVSKLQKGEAHSLTEPEKFAVARLRSSLVVVVQEDGELTEEENSRGNLGRVFKKRRAEPPAEYIDCSFILATAIDVERLWSLAKNILTDKRRGMATRMVQPILLLKENRDLWTEAMVYGSISTVKKRKASDSTPGTLEEQLATKEGINETNR